MAKERIQLMIEARHRALLKRVGIEEMVSLGEAMRRCLDRYVKYEAAIKHKETKEQQNSVTEE